MRRRDPVLTIRLRLKSSAEASADLRDCFGPFGWARPRNDGKGFSLTPYTCCHREEHEVRRRDPVLTIRHRLKSSDEASADLRDCFGPFGWARPRNDGKGFSLTPYTCCHREARAARRGDLDEIAFTPGSLCRGSQWQTENRGIECPTSCTS